MPIRPVDMQVLLPKVNEVSRIQQIQNQNEQNSQQQFASQLQKEATKQETQVQHSNKSQGGKVNKDSGNKSSSEEKEKKKKQKNEQESEIIKDPKLGNKLDIKI